MSEKKIVKPVALAVGAALAGSFALSSGIANADSVESPFAMSTMAVGYMLGAEGSCGGDKEAEASCGGDKEGDAGDKDSEAHCGGDKDGEAHCGGDKEGDAGEKDAEASCGGDKAEAEGACGEGSCGASKE